MAYVESWDESKPSGSRDANLGDDDIREFKRAIRERLAGGGMYFPSTDDASAGFFNYVKFIEQSGDPTSGADKGFLFCKDVSGVTELYWMDSAGTVVQLTSAGKLRIEVLKIASEAQGDILYHNGTSWVRLPKGTALQLIRMNAGATAPEWFENTFGTAASQAEMEAASSLTTPVTPGRAQYHPGVAKAWAMFNGATVGTNAPTAGHNVASVTRNSAGNYTVTLTTAFSSSNYVVMVNSGGTGGAGWSNLGVAAGPLSNGSFVVECVNNVGTPADVAVVCVVAFGDQ